MPAIRPISDLRNRANEISELCHCADEPVFITKNGQDDLIDIFNYIKQDKPSAAAT